MAATVRIEPMQARSIALSERARAGLNLARALTAVYVVIHHVSDASGFIGALLSFGQEAVLVFFILSGFVIFANEHHRVSRPRGYFLRRLRRIYPTLLVAMAVSAILWSLGLINATASWASFLGTVAGLQDISFLKRGVITDPFLGNDPLWSLSYEIFFYAAFPLVMVAWRRSPTVTRWSVGPVSALAYLSYLWFPNHFSLVVSYFMMWWIGAMAAYLYGQGRLRMRAALPELAGISALLASMALGVALEGFSGPGYFPFLMLRHSAVVAILFLVLLLAPLRHVLGRCAFAVRGPAARVAALSYGLYVLHYPLLVQTDLNQSWLVVPAAVGLLVLAYVADPWLDRVIPRAPRG